VTNNLAYLHATTDTVRPHTWDSLRANANQ